jgi:hypothetical protein
MRLGRLRRRHAPDQAAAPAEKAGPAGKRGRRAAVKRSACAVLACAAAGALAASVRSETDQARLYTSPGWASEFSRAYQLEECLFRSIRSSVPEGATVYVPTLEVAHAQRLAELSTLWAVPTGKAVRAAWNLNLSHATLAGYLHHKRRHGVSYRYCPDGTLLTVQRPDGDGHPAMTVGAHRHRGRRPRVGHL